MFLPHRDRSGRKSALCCPSPGRKEPGHEKWPKGAARLQLGEHCLGWGGRQTPTGETAPSLAPSSYLMLQGAAEGRAGTGELLLTEEPPATPSSQRYCRALATCLPVLEPVLRVLQPGLQVPDAHLLLLQGGQVLLRGGGLDAMVVTAQRVLHGAPAGDACQQGGRKGPGEALRLQEPGAPPTHPGPLATGALQARPPPRGPCGQENSQPLWEVGFIKTLSSDERSVRVGSSALL